MRWPRREPRPVMNMPLDQAVALLWKAMRDGRITTQEFGSIKPATELGALTAVRLLGIHVLLGTADRLPAAVRVALFDHISRGLPLFEEAS